MNIAILCYHRIGGSGIVAYEIGRAMAENKGHRVHFIGLEPPFRLQKNASQNMMFHRVCVKEYPVFDFQPYSLALASQLSHIIDRCNIDVIHSHYALPHAVSAILAKNIGNYQVRCVTTLHGTDITVIGAHPSMSNITRYAINQSDAVTAVSNHLKKETESRLEIDPGRITTVYNFINPEYFNPELKNQNAKKGDNFVILHISNLREVKAPLDVIRIFDAINKSIPDRVELQIVGEGPLQYDMIRLVDELGISDKVKFLGVVSNLGELIASGHLMLLPSKEESFGLVALEAMACGIPVIASRVGGLPEVIEDGETGFLYKSGQVDEACSKAINLIKDPELYKKMSSQAMVSIDQKFNMSKIIDQYEKIYLG